MDLVFRNPFRVLGLPLTATSKEIAKRVSDLETFVELGKAKSYPTDYSIFPGLVRTVEAIKGAARKIEQPEGRLFHSLFWFHGANSVDELALEGLAAGKPMQAMNIWERSLSRDISIPFSWRLNYASLCFATATGDSFYKDRFDKGLENLGWILDHSFDEFAQAFAGRRASAINSDSIWRRAVDEILKFTSSLSGTPYGHHGLGLLSACRSFPPEAADYLKSKTANPIIERIEEAIHRCEHQRENSPSLEGLNDCFGLADVLDDFFTLKTHLSENDLHFQTLANKLTDEVCGCAVLALNKYEEIDIAAGLIGVAARIPSSGQVKKRIEENQEVIESWVKGKEAKERHKPVASSFEFIIEKLGKDFASLQEAESFVNAASNELSKIMQVLGRDDEHYIDLSSAVVGKTLNYLIDTVNREQERGMQTRDLVHLRSVIYQAAEITRKIAGFDMAPKLQERVGSNLEVINDLQTKIPAPSSSGFEELIPWAVIIGVLILLGMCSK